MKKEINGIRAEAVLIAKAECGCWQCNQGEAMCHESMHWADAISRLFTSKDISEQCFDSTFVGNFDHSNCQDNGTSISIEPSPDTDGKFYHVNGEDLLAAMFKLRKKFNLV